MSFFLFLCFGIYNRTDDSFFFFVAAWMVTRLQQYRPARSMGWGLWSDCKYSCCQFPVRWVRCHVIVKTVTCSNQPDLGEGERKFSVPLPGLPLIQVTVTKAMFTVYTVRALVPWQWQQNVMRFVERQFLSLDHQNTPNTKYASLWLLILISWLPYVFLGWIIT